MKNFSNSSHITIIKGREQMDFFFYNNEKRLFILLGT